MPRRPPTPPTNKGASGEPADAVLDQDPTMRECLIEIAQKLYPGITPRNNYDILTLAMGVHHYSGPLTNDAVYAWLDERLLMENPSRGDKSPLEQAMLAANENCQTLLDTPGQIGGVRFPDVVHCTPLTIFSVRTTAYAAPRLHPAHPQFGVFDPVVARAAPREPVQS